MTPAPPIVRIGIVTHNRAEILPRALQSALRQDYPRLEILVVDDGSTDATSALRERFPQARWWRNEQPQGYREARNRMMQEPGADFFCSLDDDSWFLEDDALSCAVALFAEKERLGAAALQILDHSQSERSGRGPDRPAHTFVGCGHVLRLSAVAEAGWYGKVPGDYGAEEKDLSIHLLDLGWDVREMPGVHVWHDKTMTARHVDVQHGSGVCNDLAFAFKRCPWLLLPGVLPGKIFSHLLFSLRFACKSPRKLCRFEREIRQQIGALGFAGPTLRGIGRFFRHGRELMKCRQAVSLATWHEYRRRSHQSLPPYPEEKPARVTISITTRNRLQDLRETLQNLRGLSPPADEMIVVFDGMEMKTVGEVSREFPEVKLVVNPQWQGSIPSRDRILREAAGEIVLSLDDDSHPIESDFISRLKRLFTENPAVAVLTFPQITDEFPASFTQIRAQAGRRAWVGSFTNSGAALRRSIYLRLSGYVPEFRHAYEEPDYALQCIAAGYRVMVEPSLTIRHHYSRSSRNEIRTHHFHSRNELWSVFLRCPLVLLPVVAPFRVARQFIYACKRGLRWAVREPAWWLDFLRVLPLALRHRHAVNIRSYWRWMRLIRRSESLGQENMILSAQHRKHAFAVSNAIPP